MRIRRAPAGAHPSLLHPEYRSTPERAPRQPLIPLPQGAAEVSGPRFDATLFYPHHDDLTKQTVRASASSRTSISM